MSVEACSHMMNQFTPDALSTTGSRMVHHLFDSHDLAECGSRHVHQLPCMSVKVVFLSTCVFFSRPKIVIIRRQTYVVMQFTFKPKNVSTGIRWL